MRLYESLSYLNNNNNNNNHHASENIDFLSGNFQSNGNNSNSVSVKTFTSNGNQQSNNDSDLVESSKTLAEPHSYFEISESIGSDVLNSQQNWQLEADLSKAFASFNETYCFYGSHRKLKSRENLHFNDDDNANGNDVHLNVISSKDCVDLIDSSPDLEAEINRLINRGNLCRQNFEHESFKVTAPDTEEQFMDEEGNF